MPGTRAWRLFLGLGAGLLLAGLGSCSGSPEPRSHELQAAQPQSAPPLAAEHQAAEPQAPEPQASEPQASGSHSELAETPEKVLSVAAPGGEAAGEPIAAAELPEPQTESPEVGAEMVEPAPTTVAPALPVPRPPAESAKPAGKTGVTAAGKPAGKTGATAAGKPAKSAKAAAAPAAPAAKGAAAEAASPKAAERPPEPESREVLARKGDTVVIDLEGRGWLLLPGDRRGVSFLGSESGPQRTSFSFKALELGDYELAFQLQDNARGAATAQVVRLRVLPEERIRDLLASPAGKEVGHPPPQAGESADPARLEKAERLFAGGFFDLALPEYLAIYREADPLLNDRLAAIYLAKGEAAAAAKYYDRNLSAPPPYGRQAVVGLVKAGLAMASPELVLQHLPALLELPPSQTRAELLAVARFAASQGSYPLALDLLTEYLRRHPRGTGLDEAFFQLARLYELESPLRDVRLARYYYGRVYEDFPESEHAAEAHNRILYLDRHFFHVQ
jgi:tetratricopeptide (TPR) repeat protein